MTEASQLLHSIDSQLIFVSGSVSDVIHTAMNNEIQQYQR